MIQPYNDYSGHYELLRIVFRALYKALLAKDYEEAIKLTEDIIDEARLVAKWCRGEMDKEAVTTPLPRDPHP
jgi:hypothetical protein